MAAKRRKLSNPLALAVMATLAERPMHPYEIAQVLRHRGQEHSIKINYGSLYTVVQNLEKHGFVEVAGVQREGNRPERTLYGLTGPGQEELHDWLADLVAVPQKEYPLFEAALSLLLVLPVDEALRLLRERVDRLEVQATASHAVLEKLAERMPRLFLVESEYQLHMVEAEARWIRGLLAEFETGTLSGAAEWRQWQETGQPPAHWLALDTPGGHAPVFERPARPGQDDPQEDAASTT